MDVTQSILLEELECHDNVLTNLDVSQNTALDALYFDSNQLTSIDVTQNIALVRIRSQDNALTSLDLSKNIALRHLECQENALTSLNLRNGNNANTRITATDNPDLYCIQVDDAFVSFSFSSIDAQASYSTDCGTHVPDDNFEAFLETNGMGNGVANDNYVLTSAIENVTNLDISSQNIADLTGIEDFIALESLSCTRNALTTLDLSQNTKLAYLWCGDNNLTSLDVTKNTKLIELSCSTNPIGSLDVTQNILLEELNCETNQLTSLDLTQNSALIELSCLDNGLTSLDLPTNTALKYLYCNNNQLSSLDVTQSILLEELECHDNVLTSLDVSQNTALDALYFDSNQLTSIDVTQNIALVRIRSQDNALTSLDLSKNIALRHIECQENALTSLDLRNGNNANTRITATDNPNLYCIQVDDPFVSFSFSSIDAQASYSTDCGTHVPDDNFETYLETHNSIGGLVTVGDLTSMGNGIANDNYVGTERIKNITSLDVTNLGILDLTGIEDFIALKSLTCIGNSLTEIDVTKNVALTDLDLYRNALTSIDISQNVQLTSLAVADNQLTSLDITQNIKLGYLACSINQLTSLDVTQNTLLTDLSCDENELASIDVSKNLILEFLYVRYNQLTALDVTQNIALEELECTDNELASIDLTQNLALQILYTDDNQLTTLDLSQNSALERLLANNNQLTYLNLKNGNNVSTLSFVDVTDNPNLSCILVDDVAYSNTNWTDKDAHSFYNIDCRQTYIPDDILENYLETHDANGNTVSVGDITSMGNGIAGDDNVNTIAIENVTSLILEYVIPLPGQVIDPATLVSDLTGLEDFIALTELDIRFQNINTLDVTANINLETLTCFSSEVSTLDISANTKLEELTFVSNNVTTLNVSSNILLKRIYASGNTISDIDLSTNILLEQVYLNQNQLSSISFNTNSLLQKLRLNDNLLTNLDLSANSDLEDVQIQNNQLIAVNLKNGNNSSITRFEAINNPDLNCIQVDDPTEAATGTGNYSGWDKDATASYSEDCYPPVITLTGDTPQTIIFGVGYTELGATTDDGVTNVIIDASDFVDAIGTYTIRYNATDATGNVAIEVIRVVNVIGCPIYDLPSDNFQIQTASETCVDKNNGILTISAAQNHNYSTIINTETYDFTSDLVVENLAPGTYPVCIAIDGNTDCEQCFEVVIEEAATLEGKTTINTKSSTNQVQIEINSGTAPYTVMINDKVVGEYDTSSFSVDVVQGEEVEVHSSLACEGKLSAKIDVIGDIRAYPNPTASNIELTIPNIQQDIVTIEIHNTLGVLVSSRTYAVSGSTIIVPMESLSAGIYFLHMDAATPKTIKIVKE